MTADGVRLMVALLVGLVLGAAVTWLLLRTGIAVLRSRIEDERERATALRESFTAISAEALRANGEQFLALARGALAEQQQLSAGDLARRQQSVDEMVRPVREGLARVSEQLAAFDRERAAGTAALREHLALMHLSQQQLAAETRSLVQALRAPQGRGRWGELQLRRVVELAGMVEHCDFVTQETVDSEAGRRRPDLVVHLPGSKMVVVDAKTPLQGYLDALEASSDEERMAALRRHAAQVRHHVEALGRRDYADTLSGSPDFVVLFLPGEAFFQAACEIDSGLTEFAIRHDVLLATPTTLIAMLRSVAYGWNQERLAANAEAIRDLGIELHGRIRTLAEHMQGVRKGLERAIGSYNAAVGSLESRVLPSARRFGELGAASGERIAELEPVDIRPRVIGAEPGLRSVDAESADQL